MSKTWLPPSPFHVYTTNNFWAARMRPGARYDALVIANPGPNQPVGPPSGFVVDGPSFLAPTPTQPAYQGTVSLGGSTGPITLEWSGRGILFDYVEYRLTSDGAVPHTVSGAGVDSAPVTLNAGRLYTGAIRRCQTPSLLNGGGGCGPWSSTEGTGTFNFNTIQQRACLPWLDEARTGPFGFA